MLFPVLELLINDENVDAGPVLSVDTLFLGIRIERLDYNVALVRLNVFLCMIDSGCHLFFGVERSNPFLSLVTPIVFLLN